jgi:hypothetical protein
MSEPAEKHRPWRYWGINLRPEKERPRLTLLAAILFTALCVYSVFLIVRGVVWIAEDRSYGRHFIPALVLIAVFALWTGRRAIRSSRRITARRKRPSISN